MNIAIAYFTIIFLGVLITYFSKKTHISSVVFLVIAGFILSVPQIRMILIGDGSDAVEFMGKIALLALMFIAGLESSWREIYEERRDAFVIAFGATLIPFSAGFAAFLLFGYSFETAAVMGIAMSIAAEATKARVLIALKKLKTKVGAALMGAGIIDDLIGLFSFVLLAFLIGKFNIVENLMTIGAIGAFFAGLFLHKFLGRERGIVKRTEKLFLWILIPFFFVSIGLNLDISALVFNPWILLAVILLAPIATIGGALVVKPLTDLRWKQAYLVGWGMNSRGAIGLAIAFIAFKTGLLPIELYSSLVVMALLTTIAFPFVIKYLIKKHPGIMDE